MANRKTLVLVDGHALAFRAFHALKNTGMSVRSTGEPTYAVHGFFQILLTLLRERAPEYVAVSFDIGRTFRDDMYPEYKAGRSETPADFEPQLDRIKQIVEALNIPIYTAEGYEADDVIGTLCRQAEAEGVQTLIITGDTDSLQLVNDYTRVLLANPYGQKTTTTLYDADQVRERYKGLGPHQLADLRGLKGDTSDNIPGVKGIAEAGAISLLNEFGTVEGIYENLDAVQKRFRSKLEGQQEAALFSKQLAIIVTDAPVQLDLAATVVHDYDRAKAVALFAELSMRSLVEKLPVSGSAVEVVELPASAPSVASAPARVAPGGAAQMTMFPSQEAPAAPPGAGKSFGQYAAVRDAAALAEVVAALDAAPAFAFDTETTSLELYGPEPAQLVGISLSISPGQAWYIPTGHDQGDQLPLAEVVAALQPAFRDPAKGRIGHNAKFDLTMLERAGIEVGPVSYDTMLAAALLGHKPGLKDLAFDLLKDGEGAPVEMIKIEELIGKGKNQISMTGVSIEHATPYASADADMTLRLMELFAPQMADQPPVLRIFEALELPLIPVLSRIEDAGVLVDLPTLKQQGQLLGEKLAEIQAEIFRICGEECNLSSRYELNDLLFKNLKLPTNNLKKLAGTTKSGGEVYSITADILEDLKQHDDSGVVELILRHRKLSKLKSTYVDTLQTLIYPNTNRVHTTFRQIGTETGRISSDSPNLQNIPVRTDEGRELRKAFIAAPGTKLLAADYSQIELRVLAHITQDPTLVEVFKTGQDIHASTAANLYSVPIGEVTKNQRRLAKTVVFGVVYGISAFGLSARTELSRSEAQDLINALFARYPGIKDYIDRTLQTVRVQGYVETLFGRRRYFKELIGGGSGPRRQALEREAINAGIQGTAADLIKLAMVQLEERLRSGGFAARMVLQVHDELLLEVPEAEVDEVARLVCATMEGVYPELRVPLEVNIEAGPNWDELKPLTIERQA
ncbi:MAG TPA: DNA polymerase I [Herpetosiphonaceae bacterium]